jgi:enoyl-CoA hydratase/carnithine racemase
MTDSVAIEIDDRIAILKLNREKNLNAVSSDLARGVADGLIKLDDDDGVDGIVLTGAGDRAFCAGVDLIEARDAKPADIESWFGNVCNIYRQILATRKPVIAAVNGVAAGAGFQMALVSDLRVVSKTAKLGQPEINAGIPSVMGSYWMSLHIGWSKNQELSFTGRLMDAEEAYRLGIANHLVEPGEVIPRPARSPRTSPPSRRSPGRGPRRASGKLRCAASMMRSAPACSGSRKRSRRASRRRSSRSSSRAGARNRSAPVTPADPAQQT